jgi:hypothetical protein
MNFPSRKLRLQVTPKDGESEADTDVESPKEKRSKPEGDQIVDETGGVGDANGGGSSDGGGNGVPEKRGVKFDQRDATSSGLLHPQSDTKPDVSAFNRGTGFDSHSMPQGSCSSLSSSL